jgi:hypothetical protein
LLLLPLPQIALGDKAQEKKKKSAFAISESLRRDWQVGDIAEMNLGNEKWGAVQITGSHTEVSVKWAQDVEDDRHKSKHASCAQHQSDSHQSASPSAQALLHGQDQEQDDEEQQQHEWIPATSIVPKTLLGDQDFLPFDFVQRTDAMGLTESDDNNDGGAGAGNEPETRCRFGFFLFLCCPSLRVRLVC